MLDNIIFKFLMLVMSLCLIACTIGLVKALDEQTKNTVKIWEIHTFIKSIDTGCILDTKL